MLVLSREDELFPAKLNNARFGSIINRACSFVKLNSGFGVGEITMRKMDALTKNRLHFIRRVCMDNLGHLLVHRLNVDLSENLTV